MVYLKAGGKTWYDDHREVHEQIYRGDEMVKYASMAQDPDAADNRWLRDAFSSGCIGPHARGVPF